jgi:Gas vesicle synthesis protein GvpL/GvpF
VSYLVYGILNGRRLAPRPAVKGVRAQTVWMLECNDLCAALSDWEPPPSHANCESPGATPMADLLAYAKAVEAFNRCETIVPMRYGCGLRSAAEVRARISKNAGLLHMLLRRLDGCVEMGVRALLLENGPRSAAVHPAASNVARPGAAYLNARRGNLALTQRGNRVAQMVREALGGCFRECVADSRGLGPAPMVSVYFLIERTGLAAFRKSFGKIESSEAALMLSGPWPPYNFVCGAGCNESAAMKAPRAMPASA